MKQRKLSTLEDVDLRFQQVKLKTYFKSLSLTEKQVTFHVLGMNSTAYVNDRQSTMNQCFFQRIHMPVTLKDNISPLDGKLQRVDLWWTFLEKLLQGQ